MSAPDQTPAQAVETALQAGLNDFYERLDALRREWQVEGRLAHPEEFIARMVALIADDYLARGYLEWTTVNR